jgi:SAM-dependent methyltransferase
MTKYIHTTKIHNTNAASEVVPFLMSVYNPKSVVDVGCGLGTWLKVFKSKGVNKILGVDGSYVDRTLLTISEQEFHVADLECPVPIPDKFDLALCLEVAEHLKPEAAVLFIDFLTSLSDTIVFSAAVPGQGGQNHINEQWLSYWESLFNTKGFYLHDWIRSQIWENDNVDTWYKQNMVVFQKDKKEKTLMKDVVHPELFSLLTSDLDNAKQLLKDREMRLSHITEKYSLDINGKFSIRKFMRKIFSALKRI